MNGFLSLAASYRKYMQEHAEEPGIDWPSMERKAKALEVVGRTDKAGQYEIFNTGAFNDIVKGYLLLAVAEVFDNEEVEAVAALDEDDRAEFRRKLQNTVARLFDTVTAEQAEEYYTKH